MTMTKFNVIHSLWLGDEEYEAGEQEVNINKNQLKLLNHAHAAGIVELEGADPGAYGVQSQEDGEAAYAEAQESGAWQEGNVLAAEELALAAAEMPVDVEPAGEGE